jgi:nicotinamide mononucleotide adenylyltransferase
MFEMAERCARGIDFEVVGSYLSPVSDAYKKPFPVPAHNRLTMCSLAAEDTTNLMIDSWEALQYNKTGDLVYAKMVDVLRHFDYEINDVQYLVAFRLQKGPTRE